MAGGGTRDLTKILAWGRNYADHIREMEADPEPVVFLKPSTALRLPGEAVRLPRDRGPVHHEIEIAVWLGAGGADLDPAEAGSLVAAYGLGLDLTLREVQERAKQGGKPWTLAKGFDGSLPLSPLVPAASVSDPAGLRFRLEVNGSPRQTGEARRMLVPIPELLASISAWITLEPGDLILTGTPAGVGPLVPGDEARMILEGHLESTVRFV
jgi:fumarylpyruvate hydrolase